MRKSISVGYFKAPSPGEYLICRMGEIESLGDEEILVRKYISFVSLFVAIAGIILGFLSLFSIIYILDAIF